MEKAERIEFKQVLEPLEARAGARTSAWVASSTLEDMLRYRTGVFENVTTVESTLIQPAEIWEARRQLPHPRHGFCYIGYPETTRRADGSTRRLRSGEAFYVFLKEDMEVYDWRIDEAPVPDDSNPTVEGCRFGEKFYP